MKPTIVHFENCSDERFFTYHAITQENEGGRRKKKALLNLIKYVMQNDLSDKQKECVLLAKVKGFTIKEISNILCVNQSTVCRNLQAAQKKFDKAYEHFHCIDRFVDWSDIE